jgi:hypothetical protein
MVQLASMRFLIKLWKELGRIIMVGSRFHQQLEDSSNSNLYKPAEPEAPLFDVCSAVCDTPPEAGESALVRALAYFEGVIGWRIADINHI